jgi:probable rRNA maturation factor
VTVDVFAADEQNDQPVDTLRWARLAEAVLGEEGLTGDAELSVLFVDESAIAELNSRFLGKEGPTDVLAFPIDEEPIESGRSPDSGGTGPGMPSEPEDMPVLLGDIVICPAVAFRNAPEHAGNYDDEVALLVVHGLLHLMGMDHQEDEEAEEMEAKERELLARHYAEIRPETWRARAAGDGGTSPAEGEQGEAGPSGHGQSRDGQSQDGQAEVGQSGVGQSGTGQPDGRLGHDGPAGEGEGAGHRPNRPQADGDSAAGSG